MIGNVTAGFSRVSGWGKGRGRARGPDMTKVGLVVEVSVTLRSGRRIPNCGRMCKTLGFGYCGEWGGLV